MNLDRIFNGCFVGVRIFVANRRERKSASPTIVTDAKGASSAASDFSMAGHANCGQRSDVRHSIHFQCVARVSGILVDILDNGRTVFWWEIF